MMASSRLFAWLLFMARGWRISGVVNAFVVNDFTVTMLPATPIPSFRVVSRGGDLGRA
ncbi:hypothetical protein ACNKHL_13615 [Shigella flexneri]